ncbi:hypothetical protein IV493_07290 [Pantoea sp. SM3640]|uniref:hypothetical protein n=1 Tax=Pantoea sp. SM3640 TaxID=2787629 RepID=UPI0018A74749|nr:hypothetical protein [Pantoea sp. SM3640]QPG28609.1 hypothetical protein IV493_07290 [Pantoea sp. SM3640]
MHTENANRQNAFDLVQSQDFIANVAAILMPAISDAVNDAVTLATSPTMSKQDFAAANRISLSVLEKWIANGVVLLAPTPSFTYTQNRTNRKTGEVVETTMTKHGNPLINVAAWREKNRQQAIKCRYIKP